jgi:hypothetical protein
MMRQLFLLAILAVVLLPDWVTAFGRRRPYCVEPAPPVVICPPPLVLVCPPPAAAPRPNSPTVVVEPGKPEPKAEPAPPPKPVTPGVPMGSERPAREASPPPAPPVRPAALAVPKPTDPKPVAPLQLKPVDPGPKPDVPVVPLVVPQPAEPAAKEEKLPTIPKLTPSLPGGADGLPPLAIPQQGEAGKSTSRSSPLAGMRPTVDVLPVDGPAPADSAAKRKVGFFNHTDRDLQLSVEGATITLPRRHYVAAEVPAKFVWRVDGGAEQTTEIPASAPGVEVVFRK